MSIGTCLVGKCQIGTCPDTERASLLYFGRNDSVVIPTVRMTHSGFNAGPENRSPWPPEADLEVQSYAKGLLVP